MHRKKKKKTCVKNGICCPPPHPTPPTFRTWCSPHCLLPFCSPPHSTQPGSTWSVTFGILFLISISEKKNKTKKSFCTCGSLGF
uniref:Uncharacterized protein n=1 Tax=Anguilla anguilla TaxID=7936 RepID=A0A0E9WX13_ANGAN